MPKTLGVETNPAKANVAAGGSAENEGYGEKQDDNQPFERGLSGVGCETCWGSVASSSQSSASISPISLSSALASVDMPSMISEILNSPRMVSISSIVSFPNKRYRRPDISSQDYPVHQAQ